jgi:hypothetical protein
MKKNFKILFGIIVGMICGFLAARLSRPSTSEANAIALNAYLPYTTAEDKGILKGLGQNETQAGAVEIAQFRLVEDFVRLVYLRKLLNDDTYANVEFYSVKLYLQAHPEAWKEWPDKNLNMLPDDPLLPTVVNVHELVQTELNK